MGVVVVEKLKCDLNLSGKFFDSGLTVFKCIKTEHGINFGKIELFSCDNLNF